MKIRKPNKPDQYEKEKEFQILLKALRENPEMEQILWAAACSMSVVSGCLNSEVQLKLVIEDIEDAK